MGGTKNLVLISIAKEIWNFLIQTGITITIEYLPNKLNVLADWESRNYSDLSDWNLDPLLFQMLTSMSFLP